MAGKLAVGGGGRYLILEIPLKRILVIFDVAKGKLTHEIPGDDVILFAAGAKHVVVLHPIDEKIRFFGLSDGKEDRSVPLPKELVGKEINQACMASAKEGPLFVYLPKEFRTHSLNLQTMSVTEIPWSNWGPHKGPGPNNIRTTPDGSVLAGFGANTERLTMKDGKPYGQGVFMSSSHSPGSLSTDGKWIYTNWAIYAANGVGAKIPDHDKAYFVAPHEPGYFLVLFRSERQMYKRDGQVYPDAMQDPIVFSDSRQRLFVIPDCDEFRKPNKLSWEQRIHYYPRAGVLVTISGDADELILHTAGPNK